MKIYAHIIKYIIKIIILMIFIQLINLYSGGYILSSKQGAILHKKGAVLDFFDSYVWQPRFGRVFFFEESSYYKADTLGWIGFPVTVFFRGFLMKDKKLYTYSYEEGFSFFKYEKLKIHPSSMYKNDGCFNEDDFIKEHKKQKKEQKEQKERQLDDFIRRQLRTCKKAEEQTSFYNVITLSSLRRPSLRRQTN